MTMAGCNSQFLTHSIDIYFNRQGSKPIIIGNYCFISTRVTILGGSSLPDKSVLAAGAVLETTVWMMLWACMQVFLLSARKT